MILSNRYSSIYASKDCLEVFKLKSIYETSISSYLIIL